MRFTVVARALFLGSFVGTAVFTQVALGTTESRFAGIITAVEPTRLTIAPMRSKEAVTGLIDGQRTKITIDGHAARPNELHITYAAKAELGLDDVWVSVAAESR